VFDGTSARTRCFAPIERALYRLCRVDPAASMSWQQYALSMLAFNALGALALYALQRWQAQLPWNPQQLSAVTPDSAFNTAVSFITNTNWQGYGGESTMSYLTQMLGLGRAELPVGGDRDRGAGGADPWLHAAPDAAHRQLLGRRDAQHAVRAAAAVAAAGRGAGRPGRGAEFQALPERGAAQSHHGR
jgi:hypothetical protein